MAGDTLPPHISEEEMAVYKRTALRRLEAERRRRDARRVRGWELAREAAALLKRDYGAARVVAFGSLLDPERFTEQSDVDVAAWGLTSANWLKAMGAVQDLSREIEINLVDVGACSPALLAAIERDGVEL
ncbi:MAG: nucleotidyltransferase domain-containing protein [Anaerolineae bacterium]